MIKKIDRGALLKNALVFIILFFIAATANANGKLVFSTGQETTIQNISELVLIEAYRKIGYDVRVERMPNARSIFSSNDGQFDGEVSRIEGINKKFTNLIRIPISVNFVEGHAFSKNKDLYVKNWESLRHYKLLCVKGVKFVENNLVERNIQYNNVTFFTQAVKLLQSERYEIAVFPKINGIDAIRRAKIADVVPVGKPLNKTKLYHYLHKKNADIVPEIRDVLAEMEKNGRIVEIRAEYIHQHNY